MHNDRYYRLRLDYFPLIFLFFVFPAHSYQNLAVATGANDFYFDTVKNQTFARFSANDPIYNSSNHTVTTTRPYNIVGMDGKTYQATITRTAAADIPKVGAALSKFAQRVGPLSMALATADLICSLTTLCNQAGVWYYGEEISTVTTLSCAAVGTGVVQYLSGGYYNRYKLISHQNCGSTVPSGWGYVAGCSPSVTGCAWGDLMIKEIAGSPAAYPQKAPATPSNWTASEPALSTPAAADRLASELEPLPIQQPMAYSPVSLPLGSITVTNKDASGVSTGTQTTTRRLQIEDAATLIEPNRAKVEEIATKTDYDLNNQPLSSTETSSEPQIQPQTEPQKIDFPDYQAEFDTVTDTELPTSEFSADFNPTSWGSSATCPPDLTTTVRGVNLAIRTAPICDAAETFRPLILVLAALSAAGIALGVRTRGAD